MPGQFVLKLLPDEPLDVQFGEVAQTPPSEVGQDVAAECQAITVDIYAEPFPPTGSRRRISQNGGYWPLWSRDGGELFYRPARSTLGITLRSVDIETEPAFSFSNEQTLPIDRFIVVGYHRDYDITPDGERFLMVFPADEAEGGEPAQPQINVVLNWFEELKERVPVP